ncbi:MAG: hypothetical protein WCO42_09310 [bacterium]
MKSLTIHALDDQLAAQIKHRAKELSISIPINDVWTPPTQPKADRIS